MTNEMTPKSICFSKKLSQFDDLWSPKIVAELNGQHFKLAKLEGEFPWHHHDETDECFLVIEGELEMDFREGTRKLQAGEMIVIPAKVEHRPRAKKLCSVLLIERAGTENTGSALGATESESQVPQTTSGEWLT